MRRDKYTYVDEINGYILSVIYDEQDSEITGYAVAVNGVSNSYKFKMLY